jgi:hypothetical protein
MEAFRKYGIGVSVDFCKNDSLVSRARNNLVARAMNNPAMTHIMFIDNDITWDPIDIMKLLISNKQLVGGIYPLKHYNWNNLLHDKKNPNSDNIVKDWIKNKNNSQFKDIISDEHMVQYKMLSYNVNYLNTTIQVENNLTQVKHLATGFMMIQRNVITSLSKAFPSTKYTDDVSFLRPEENKYAFALSVLLYFEDFTPRIIFLSSFGSILVFFFKLSSNLFSFNSNFSSVFKDFASTSTSSSVSS